MNPEQADAGRWDAEDALHGAILEGDDGRARRVIARWPRVANAPWALVLAAQYGRAAVVADLLAAGATPDVADELGVTPLLAAARGGHLGVVTMLVEAGAMGKVVDAGSVAREVVARVRFSAAVGAGDVEGMRRLLGEWPRLIAVGEPLAIAVELGRVEATRLLLDAGASPRVRDEEGVPLVVIAADLGYFEIVRMLLDAGAEQNVGIYREPPRPTS